MPEFAERILHVDMDAFYVEVERRTRPELVGVPVVVGGLGRRGVVAAASYEARRYGVHSAMPVVNARRLCPQARFVPPDMARYRDASVQVFEILRAFTPLVEGLSVDEAFLDIAGLRLHYPEPRAVGDAIRSRIRGELTLPASVGVATNKFLAKMASEAAKPDGLAVVEAGSELDFLHPRPVRALWGVGEATYAALEGLGVVTIGDLAAIPLPTLEKRLGASLGSHLWALAHARDDRTVLPDNEAKSVSAEETYSIDLVGAPRAAAELLRQTDRLVARLRRSGLAARTVTLKVRYPDFTTITRSHTLDAPIDVPRDAYRIVEELARSVPLGERPVRLLGVGFSGLVPAGAPRQLGLERDEAWDAVADAVDAIRERFGHEALGPASLAHPSRTAEPKPGAK